MKNWNYGNALRVTFIGVSVKVTLATPKKE